MISIKRSRSYFGRNVYGEEPAAYLCIDPGPAAADCADDHVLSVWRRIDEMVPTVRAVPESGTAEERSSATAGERPEPRLATLIEALVERSCRAVGVSCRTLRWGAFSADCGMELVVNCDDAEAGRRAAEWAVRLLDLALTAGENTDALADEGCKLAAELEALRKFTADRRPSATGAAIIAAARERGIPVIHLDRWPLVDDNNAAAVPRGLLQIGWGIHGVRILGTATDRVPVENLAVLEHRHTLHDRLRKAGVPVPYRDAEFRNVNSASRAARLASRIGYPVVIKPEHRAGGKGSRGPLHSEAEVLEAYDRLSSTGARHVVIERHISGDAYRLLVIGGEIAAAKRFPEASEEPDTEFDLDAISPSTQDAAVAAARCFALPIAVVELVTTDPSVSLADSGGAFVGLDPAPDLAAYLVGKERIPVKAARRLLAQLFPPGTDGRIPVCAVTGTNGKTTTSRMAAKILQQAGYRVGLACTDGVYVNGNRVVEGTASGISGALAVFLSRDVDLAVLETSRGTLVSKGLAFDRCDAAACTNIASDHLDDEGIETLEQLANLKRLVVESATRCAVVNADDPLCVAMLPYVTAEHTCLTSTTNASAPLASHVEGGGQAIVLESAVNSRSIRLRDKEGSAAIIEPEKIPATWNGAAQHNVENAMFASALTLGLGVSAHIVRAALEQFSASVDETPGRINIYDKLPFRVILDFAHNPHGMRALCEFVQKLDPAGRRHLVVYWTRNTPRETDLKEAMKTVAPVFDRFICRDAAGTAEESEGRTARRVEQALIGAGVPPEAVRVIPNFETAIETALHEAAPGDLVVIITGSKASDVWRQVDTHRLRREAEEAGI